MTNFEPQSGTERSIRRPGGCGRRRQATSQVCRRDEPERDDGGMGQDHRPAPPPGHRLAGRQDQGRRRQAAGLVPGTARPQGEVRPTHLNLFQRHQGMMLFHVFSIQEGN